MLSVNTSWTELEGDSSAVRIIRLWGRGVLGGVESTDDDEVSESSFSLGSHDVVVELGGGT